MRFFLACFVLLCASLKLLKVLHFILRNSHLVLCFSFDTYCVSSLFLSMYIHKCNNFLGAKQITQSEDNAVFKILYLAVVGQQQACRSIAVALG